MVADPCLVLYFLYPDPRLRRIGSVLDGRGGFHIHRCTTRSKSGHAWKVASGWTRAAVCRLS